MSGADPQGRRPGFTLVEILVAATLLLIALGLALSVLFPALRLSARGALRSHLEQSAAISLHRVLADLNRSAPGAIRVAAEPTAVVVGIHRLETVTPQGTQVWEDRLTVYSWTARDGVLVRKTWPPDPPALGRTPDQGQPFLLTADELGQVATSRNGTESTLARDIREFELDLGSPPGLAPPFRVRLVLVHEGLTRERFELVRTFRLPNSVQ